MALAQANRLVHSTLGTMGVLDVFPVFDTRGRRCDTSGAPVGREVVKRDTFTASQVPDAAGSGPTVRRSVGFLPTL